MTRENIMVLNSQDRLAFRQWLQCWKSRGITHVPKVLLEEQTVVSAPGGAVVPSSRMAAQGAASVGAASSASVIASGVVGSTSHVGGAKDVADAVSHSGLTEGMVSKPETSTDAGPKEWTLPSLPREARARELGELAKCVKACTLCEQLVRSRKNTVFGVGDEHAKVVFFGEAPSLEEDRQGQLLIGKAGELLDKIIAAAKLKREDVYIMNTLKCRPPDIRAPSENEVEKCRPFFEKQLELIQPAYIVCLGVVAVRALLGGTEPIGRLRGRWHTYRGSKLLVTYHPSFLLRNEDAKRYAWEDIQMLMRDLGIPIR